MSQSLPVQDLPDVTAMLTLLSAYPPSQRQERVLRLIASRYYRKGFCFAKHETLAKAVGCAKSTVQLDLDELEVRGFINITRRIGTSNVTILAPGLIDALRTQRLERKRAAFIARFGVGSVVTAAQSCERKAREMFAQLSEHAETAVQSFVQKTAETQNVLSRFLNRPKAVVQPITVISLPKDLRYLTSPMRLHGDADKIKDVLINEGVSKKQASLLVQRFGIERVKRNLALELHKSAANPGGYLATAIREDFASVQVQPNSEAAAARERESYKPPHRPAATAILEPLPAIVSPHETVSEGFSQLPAETQEHYLQDAIASIVAKPPAWLRTALERHGPTHVTIQSAARAQAVSAWKATR